MPPQIFFVDFSRFASFDAAFLRHTFSLRHALRAAFIILSFLLRHFTPLRQTPMLMFFRRFHYFLPDACCALSPDACFDAATTPSCFFFLSFKDAAAAAAAAHAFRFTAMLRPLLLDAMSSLFD